jgi:putative ATP-dependent endonuclease of OLD family
VLLSHVEIEGFRAIRRLELALDPVTALIAENSFGKTSLIEALVLCLGAGVEGAGPTFAPDDFHVPWDAPDRPEHRVRIHLSFQESFPGEWAQASHAALAPLLAAASGRPVRHPEIRLEITATRAASGAPIEATVTFVDGAGTPLAAGNDPSLLGVVRRLCPVLVVRANRYFVEPARNGAPAAPPPGARLRDTDTARLAQEVELVYAKLAKGVDPAAVRQGLAAVDELYERLARSLHAEPTGPSRLLQRIAQSPRAAGREPPAPRRRWGRAEQSAAMLLLLGALLQAQGSHALGFAATPLVVLEEPEAHLHPVLVAGTWRLVEQLPTQKLVTTNSGELLAAVPLHSIRRLGPEPEGMRAHRVGEHTLSTDDLRRVAYHIRVNRASAMFARCWLLVEGETESWLLPELARVLGFDLPSEGVRLVEFAQCGAGPLIKLARDLGIGWHLLCDGDVAGQGYAATARELAGRDADRHVTALREPDVEHHLWRHGFEDVYRRVAHVPRGSGDPRSRARHDKPELVIQKAMRALSKPRLALAVSEAAAARGPGSVPGPLRAVLETTVSLARAAGL